MARCSEIRQPCARGARRGTVKETSMRITHLKHAAMIGAVSLFVSGAAHAAEVIRFNSNGATAGVNAFDGTTFLDLGVNRSDQGQSATAFLSFVRETCDATFTVCSGIRGFGNIPNGTLAINPGNARLNVNLATVAGFTVFSYVNDFGSGTFTQTPITGDVITIDWAIMPRNKTSRSGHESLSAGGFSVHFNGQSTSNRATATGSVFGSQVAPGASAFVGTNKTASITIIRD
jgi:hypothetical protein